ncbi:MAG: phosphotransferase [Gemmatimonadales bacterium]
MALTAPIRDAAMPWLEAALDRDAAAAAALATGLRPGALPGGDRRLESAALIRHKTGRRALIEYVVRDGSDTRHRILLKCRVREADRRTAALHDGLAAGARSGWTVPRTLGVVPAFHGWLQAWCPGTDGFTALAASNGVAAAGAIGGALAGLHGAATTDRRHGLPAELGVAMRALDGLGERDRTLKSRLDRIRSGLIRRCRSIRATHPRLLHRDFYPDQVLVHGATVILLDLDLHAMGDAALDLGNFIGHLIEHDLRTGSNLAALGPAFVDGYRTAGGRADAGAIDGYLTLTLARHIALSTIIPGRRHTTAALLDLCERRLAGAS